MRSRIINALATQLGRSVRHLQHQQQPQHDAVHSVLNGCWRSWLSTSTGGGPAAAMAAAKSRGAHPCPSIPWRSFATNAPGASGGHRFVAAGKAAAAAQGAGSVKQGTPGASSSSFSQWAHNFAAAPWIVKFLGLSGAIPFLVLAPPVTKHLTGVLPADIVDNCGTLQVHSVSLWVLPGPGDKCSTLL
jgi:hypothetical protein